VGTTAASQEALIGQVIGGRYEVVRLIGKGGMGAIYEVRNTRLGRSFAIKTLSLEAAAHASRLQRFRREADVIARIKHPNIVEVIDWESLEDGSPAIVMEYLRGEDLAHRLARGPLAWPVLARIADQMLAAVSVAHAHGIVHRDLKPDNVFLALDDAGDERVKLLDFGVSKVRDTQGLVTTEDRLLGTPAYMSPEQADGRVSDIGAHSDVWAIGAILHEMATGEVAFSAPSVPSILYKICCGAPASLVDGRPDAPPAFVDVVSAALSRVPERRIGDATVLRARLREALAEVAGLHFADALPAPTAARPPAISADPTPAPTPTSTLVARRKLAPFAVAIVSLAAFVFVVAVVLATRVRPARSASSAPTSIRPGNGATGAATETIDAAIAVEPVAPPDAASEIAAEPPRDGALAKQKRSTTVQPHPDVPAKPEPATVEVPKLDRKQTKCAKDDVECLYGDGT
jgi:eukaryotic-like serine/threonine-protein kinase